MIDLEEALRLPQIWILCCSPDKNDGSVLNKRKKIILLSLVETVDLINEQNGLFPIHAEIVLCLLYNCFHIFLPCYGCIDLRKAGACSIGDDFCRVVFPVPGGP